MFLHNYIQFFITLINVSYILTIQFNTKHYVTFKPPKVNQVHQSFGSSVAMIKSNATVRFIIGAPIGNSNVIKIPRTGLVYSCIVKDNWTSSKCNEIPLDLKSNKKLIKIRTPFTSGMNLGLNLGIDSVNNLATICGHLHSNNNQQPSGICFLVNLITNKVVKILSPKSRKSFGPHSVKKIPFKTFQSHEMFGFSSTFSRNFDSMIIGIPGFDTFRGSILSLSNNLNLSQSTNLSLNTVKDLDQDSYLGYSLATGKYFKSDGELIAVSAPRGKQLKGQVLIMSTNSDGLYGQVIQDLEGHQLGEYFGYSIQSIDLNGDELDDLLIGSPFYMPSNNPRGDCGRVYIYYSDGQQLNRSSIILEGDSLFGSRFGSSLAFIGDIDLDGVNDFAVGAPQENQGSGSVYIYSGSKIKSSKKYLQKIDSAKSFGLSGFGSSIHSTIDVDNDKCPDILIGCSTSDAAVLLRCQK